MDPLDIKSFNQKLENILLEAGYQAQRLGREFHQFMNHNNIITLPAANYSLKRHYVKVDHFDALKESNSFSFDIDSESKNAKNCLNFLKEHSKLKR